MATDPKYYPAIIFIAIVLLVIFSGAWLFNSPSNIDNQPFEAKSSDVNVVFPNATGYVNDAAGVLSVGDLTEITNLLDTADNDKAIQIAVLTLESTSPLSIEEYGIRLGEKWKVGFKGADNGAIIIIATKDRKVRIEVGKGLEATVTDAIAGDIIRDVMTSELKKGNWAGAIIKGAQAIRTYNK